MINRSIHTQQINFNSKRTESKKKRFVLILQETRKDDGYIRLRSEGSTVWSLENLDSDAVTGMEREEKGRRALLSFVTKTDDPAFDLWDKIRRARHFVNRRNKRERQRHKSTSFHNKIPPGFLLALILIVLSISLSLYRNSSS